MLRFALVWLLAGLSFAQQLDLERLNGIEARAIGPAGMSGRVTSIDVIRDRPNVIYIGTASGGLWMSDNGGTSWDPLFDDQPCASIGALAINQNNPSIIWAGTGEGNPRNSQTSGCGIFKSLDGGKTWQNMGLEGTRNIHRVILHPTDENTAWVGAQGSAWGDSEDRGVFKTTDGGKTWKKVLYVDKNVGVADLIADPTNPNKLICAMWEFRRQPWFFTSGGAKSGLHISHDGGETWTQRTAEDGLPKGDLGRMGLAIAPSMPNRMYALIEAKKNALYRSDDGGIKWKKVSDKNIGNRPFYYADIFVDPQNENRIYNLHSIVTVSEDAGKTFSTLIPWNKVHPDHHAWYVHPDNPNYLINGNDGGMAISHDRGKSWRFVENLPLAQFYHINVDNEQPYNLYGGMQDNGSWRGPSRLLRRGGIRNDAWTEVGFGDGFDVIPDAEDTRYGYGLWQGGNLYRYDRKTGSNQNIKPGQTDDTPLRFNWDAAIAQDPHMKSGLYLGSQFLMKSDDHGKTWRRLSPDLTTNDPERQKQLVSGGLTYDVTQAENFTTITAIAPSTLDKGTIWVGTDDGNVQLTTDGGENWTNVVDNIKGLAKGTWVKQLRASTYDAKTAFVVLEDHRRDNWAPYVYRTNDLGKTWTSLATAKDVEGYVLSIIQDPKEPKLFFLGTEFGLYVSIDEAKTWTKWTKGYPTVSTMDLAIQERDGDLAVGTFGRSAYVLDDIGFLRQLAAQGTSLLDEKVKVLPIRTGIDYAFAQALGTRFAADGIFAGENHPAVMTFDFVYNPIPKKEKEGDEKAEGKESKKGEDKAKKKKKKKGKKKKGAKEDTPEKVVEKKKKPKGEKLKVEILNSSDAVIRTFKVEAKPGLNRASWNFRQKGMRWITQERPKKKDAPEPSRGGVLPGTYKVRIHNGEQSDTMTFEFKGDPRLNALSDAQIAERAENIEAYEAIHGRVLEACDKLRDAQAAIKFVKKGLKHKKEDEAVKDFFKESDELSKEIDTLLDNFYNKSEKKGIYRDPNKVDSVLGSAMGWTMSTTSAPNANVKSYLERAEKRASEEVEKVDTFLNESWKAYKEKAKSMPLSFFGDEDQGF